MRINELYQVLSGLLLLASTLECGRSDHVHLKIHIPNIKHNHKHTKTKYIHIFHPKAIHSDHSSVQFLHSRRDPNIGLVNGGYPQPLINLQEHQPELRITEEEFMKWRQEQLRKALEDRKRLQEEQAIDADDEREDDMYEGKNYKNVNEEGGEESYTDELYKKHKANKANSSSGRKESSKHKNHNYNQDFEASNSDKSYANYPTRTSNKRKTSKLAKNVQSGRNRPQKTSQKTYKQPDTQASNVQLQYQNVDPTILDPSYYSTLPRDQEMRASNHQDDIYSGLMSRKYNKNTADKSKLLGDINYNRKTQTKLYASRRIDQ